MELSNTVNTIKNISKSNIIKTMIVSLILTIIIEFIKYEHIGDIINFLISYKIFIINYSIIISTISIALWFNKKYFIIAIISTIWILLSIINRFLTNIRGIPISFADIYSISDGLSIVNRYINIEIVVFTIVLIVILLIIYKKLWKYNNKTNRADKIMSMIIILLTFTGIYIVEENNIFYITNWNLKLSYETYGFPYSIINSIYSARVSKPDQYNAYNMNQIKKDINKNTINQTNIEYKNIIVIQLESFMDPNLIEGVEYNIDPISNFRKIYNNTISGDLNVPAFGGKTVRTEFEFLTGMNLDYMSIGEVPYVSSTGRKVIESITNIMEGNNYESTAIHNFQGNFYRRDEVFSNLGFSRYISMEYMKDAEIDKDIYQNDSMLFDSIMDIIELNDKNKFIYGITAGTHGPYSLNNIEDNFEIKIVRNDKNIDYENIDKITDYVNRLYKLDKEIGLFIEYINSLGEDSLVVMYSDHLPSIYDTQNEDYKKDIYKAPYLIYSTKSNEKEELNLEAYQLSTCILDMIGIEGGMMNKLQATYKDNENYQKYMELVQYDILYGEKYLYDGNYTYEKSNLQLGIEEIKISDFNIENEKLTIFGSGFNQTSKIYINKKMIDTIYVDENELIADIKNIKNIKNISVNQVGQNNKSLSSTELVSLKNEEKVKG